MELICPSCEARYQLPDGAIGEKGRQVSCMNCGHGWHAYPPLVLGTSQRAGGAAKDVGIPFGAASGGRPVTSAPGAVVGAGPGTGAGSAEPAVAERDVMSSGGVPERSTGSRTEQLAEIREMLAEVQAEEQSGLAAAPRADKDMAGGAADAGMSPRAPMPAEQERSSGPDNAGTTAAVAATTAKTMGADEEVDALRARLQQQADKTGKAKEVDVKALRRKHDRKERTRKREKAAGSGAFLTGFMLVVMVMAVMIGLYVLHPAIISRLPGTEPALTEYVATIDGLRVSVAETFEKARSWVAERSDKG